MAPRFLLDTSVFSQPLRRKPVQAALRRWSAVSDTACAVARMTARQLLIGEPVEDLDLLIAALASCRKLVVATLNHRDFSRIEGIAWESWAELRKA